MTTISTSDIEHLASLSNIQLSSEETDGLRTDLENIIGYVKQLDELDTTGVEPTYQVLPLENMWREDKIQEDIGREELLALAHSSKDEQIKVPQVL